MKKLFKFFVILLILVGVAIGAAMYFTSDLKTTANNFFTAIKKGNYNQAEQYLSTNFKQATTMDQLKRAFPYTRFKKYESCSFSTRVANADGTGKLKGKIKFTDGSVMPVEIALVKENDTWKIDHINLPRPGIIENPPVTKANPNPPTMQNLKPKTTNFIKLVKETMQKLGSAIASGYYSDFYNYTAPQLRSSVPIEKLAKAFSPFKSAPIDWKNVGNLSPVIQKKEKEQNGVVKLIGYFPSEPRKVGFDFEYYKNGDKWQLVGVYLRLQD